MCFNHGYPEELRKNHCPLPTTFGMCASVHTDHNKSHANGIANDGSRCIAEVQAEEVGGADSMSAYGESPHAEVSDGGAARRSLDGPLSQ